MADDDVTTAAHTLREDPVADAAQVASTYLTLALAAAQAYVRMAAARAQARAEQPAPATAQGPDVSTPQDWAADYAAAVREVLEGDVAHRVLADRAWPALVGVLEQVRAAGGEPGVLLREVAAQRELDSAHSAAEVLAYRLIGRVETTPTAGEIAARTFPNPVSDQVGSLSASTAPPGYIASKMSATPAYHAHPRAKQMSVPHPINTRATRRPRITK